MRSVNKRGDRISGDLAIVLRMFERGLKSPNAATYVHDGQLMCDVLAEAVHKGVDPGPEVERESRGLMRFGHQHFGYAAFGRRVLESGLSEDEAMAALASGEWDPFADVEIPR
jgi:hypothetical protein